MKTTASAIEGTSVKPAPLGVNAGNHGELPCERRWQFFLINSAGKLAGGGWVIASSELGARSTAELLLAGNAQVVMGPRELMILMGGP